MVLYGAESWTLRAADRKYLESFEMWCWRRTEKISWTDHVRNEEVLLRVNKQRNILREIRKRKANWICHILRRNCLLKQVMGGKIKGEMEVRRRRGRRRKKLLDDLKDRRGYSHLKEEALDRTMWRNHFGGSFGPVVRQNTEWMKNMTLSPIRGADKHFVDQEVYCSWTAVEVEATSFLETLVNIHQSSYPQIQE